MLKIIFKLTYLIYIFVTLILNLPKNTTYLFDFILSFPLNKKFFNGN